MPARGAGGRKDRKSKTKNGFRIFNLTFWEKYVIIIKKVGDFVNYCVSARQPEIVLKQAEEMLMDYKDINVMYDYIEKYPNIKFVIRIPKDAEVNWDELAGFAARVNLIIALEDMLQAETLKQLNLKYMWAYPVKTYDELSSLAELGASEVLLGAPLYFELADVARKGMKIRLVANLCDDKMLPHKNGVCGTYVRPEDVNAYEEYVTTLEFRTDSIKREAALFDIYHNKKVWPGNLNLLLDNFGVHVDNRGIQGNFAKMRMNCGQRCKKANRCHFCDTTIRLSLAADKYIHNQKESEVASKE